MNDIPLIKTLLLIIPLVIISWVLIHLLAIFGVFLGFAYPMWWLFAPKQTVCFICRAAPNGSTCPLCHKHIEKSHGVYPKTLRSVVLNGILIVMFSLVSIGVVFGESQILFKLGFPPTPKTATFAIPTKGQYLLGEVFPMKIEINNLRTPINTVQTDIGFDPTKLEVVDISTKGSFANLFVQKDINNSGGWVRLTGGLPNPGYDAAAGTFGTIYFRGKSPGVTKISFLTTSLVLANDGRGTNILKEYPSVTYFILPERVSAEEEKAQAAVVKNDVLGASTGEGQLDFSDEGRQVLGASTAREIDKQAGSSAGEVFLKTLETVDRFALEGWGRVAGTFIK